MAGNGQSDFKELTSPFLKEKMKELKTEYGPESKEYQAIAGQYKKSDKEVEIDDQRQRRRHYEADMYGDEKGLQLLGVERLYRRSVVLEPTTFCMAHCRWCLRAHYNIKSLTPEDVTAAMEYFASDRELREILITGGDPMIVPPLLEFILDRVEEMVPHIEIVRVGTRILSQDPKKVDENILRILRKDRGYRTEIGVHICHPLEFWPETVEGLNKFLGLGIRIYNQHPLLKGVNDSAEILIELYDKMRYYGIEPHYLFHCVPMRGMDHYRTSIMKGIELISILDSGGHFSGRCKPHYAAMTDIGKVVLYHGSILDRNEKENLVLLKSSYRYEDRIRWNPSWVKPESCVLDDSGFMNVWYPDGDDKPG